MEHRTSDMPEEKARNCWASIGVRGDKSCAALVEYAHCRNCPTYSEIAATLLDRPTIPRSDDDEAIYHGSVPIGRAKDQSALVVRLGSEWMGIAIQALDEVVEMRPIHHLPHQASPVVMGVANIHGELVLCLSLDRLLGIDADAGVGKTRRLLVLRSPSGRLAVPVDEVQHTHSYEAADIIDPPAIIGRFGKSFTTGLLRWRDRTIARIDEQRVIEALERCLG